MATTLLEDEAACARLCVDFANHLDARRYAQVLDLFTEDAALDRYEFIRDGYMQRRESQVHPDGNPRAKAKTDDDVAPAAETSAPVSSESAPKELNSGTPPAANKDSL